MIYARIFGRDVPIESGDVKWSAFAPPEFNITIPAVYIDDLNAVQNESVEIYQDGELYISGYVFDALGLSVSKSGSVNASLGCLGDLGRLTCYRAKSDANYNNVPYSLILQDLLSITDGEWFFVDRIVNWAVTWDLINFEYDISGGYGSGRNVDHSLTIDLRDKETLWAQVAEIIRIIYPQVVITYAGVNPCTGWYELRSSYRGDHLGVPLYSYSEERLIAGDNLVDIKQTKNPVKPYILVESYGNVEDGKTVTLEHAEANSVVTDHFEYSTYPISQIGDTWCVEDQTPGKTGCSTVVDFPEIKTSSLGTPPTYNAQTLNAGYTLWLNTVRFIKEHDGGKTFSASGYFLSPPTIGDLVYVDAIIKEPVYDPFSHQIAEYKEVFEISEWLYITKVSHGFESAQKIGDMSTGEPRYLYDLELSENQIPQNLSNDVNLYKKLKKKDKQRNTTYLEVIDTEIFGYASSFPFDEDWKYLCNGCSDVYPDARVDTASGVAPVGTKTVGVRFHFTSNDPDMRYNVNRVEVDPASPAEIAYCLEVSDDSYLSGQAGLQVITEFMYLG